ncbi:hypothetical protein MJO28_016937 [Puccinia striiformis f. sp. tritici]|uniref:Uncharacterized protein n=2 Tax=Puccinia striiformis TaxID=27350 RepID=A0A2S4WIU3_9BASI|nr:hypothetical protein MJO28_016937 [Puccinia striiformis f. sp. tritici]POW04988.1 hypothetical protein PSTT_10009 [Puccinia striiformis]POW21607.1 hypothetical protein PSHT_02119 [Puccinia striiformis]
MSPKVLPPSGRQLPSTTACRKHIKSSQATNNVTENPASQNRGTDISKLVNNFNHGIWKRVKNISKVNRSTLVASYEKLVAKKKETLQLQVPSASPQVPSASPQVPSVSPQVPSVSPQVPSVSPHVPSASLQVPSTASQVLSTSPQGLPPASGHFICV